MSNKIDTNSKGTYFSLINVISNIFHGAPFFLRKDLLWGKIRVPPFPIFFSILSGILLYFPFFMKTYRMEVSRTGYQASLNVIDVIYKFLFSCVIGILLIVILNFINLIWYRNIIKYFQEKHNLVSENYIVGSQRILYYSSFYQLLLFIAFIAVYWASLYFTSYIIDIFTVIIIIFFGIIRLFSVIRGMLYEVNGSKIPALYSTFLCFDVWLMYLWIFAFFLST